VFKPETSHPARGALRGATGRRAAILALGVAATLSGVGCEADGWLWDPSVVGRWEHTPTVVPVLEHIDIIERDRGDFVEATEITPGDLLPMVEDYEIGPGDTLQLEIFDFIAADTPSLYERRVDNRGTITLPQIGRVNVMGLTAEEVRERLREVLREQGLIEDALVTVQVSGQRQATYSIYGAVTGVGRYFVPTPDYRLLEALTEAGGISSAVQKVYVIRQVPLSDEVQRGEGVEPAEKPARPDAEPDEGPDLIDLIDELSEPDGGDDGTGGSPGEFGAGLSPSVLGGGWQDAGRASQQEERSGDRARREQAGAEGQAPPIDLVDEPGERDEGPAETDGPAAQTPPTRWMFLNGEWVRVRRERVRDPEGLPEAEDPLAAATIGADDLVTQRIIEIPTGPLLQGVAEYNVVIRPGDLIRVPPPAQGQVYMGGPGIARAGTYNLPTFGRLTLTKAIIAAGGLNAVAWPTKVDLTRMVGPNSQATIRLNLKAIYAGAQPDIFLKPDDVVNVGTDFWATPLAVIRNGFRASYGFGFLLDRNFGNDVFGAPPTNRLGG